MDLTLYWFMFPVAICVATSAMLSGIGGAALFTPIFILVFPLLGPEYVLSSTVAAIGTALLTETFGFTSGLIGYHMKRTIDFQLARQFLKVSVPAGIAGAFLAHLVAEGLLIAGYALLVLGLAVVHVFFEYEGVPTHGQADPATAGDLRIVIDSDGREYRYRAPRAGLGSGLFTAVGAFLTGMVSVGIGEVIVPQLTKRGVPVAIAAATSVAVVIVTAVCASFTLIGQLISEAGLSAVPWNLVMYSIPGVIIGGQIGPRLQGRISHRSMELAIAGLFVVLGIAMMLVATQKLGYWGGA
ncbi:MAG: sulfite exporter TauE/SafE family protein [Halieaceae bacterium]|nr:sulfite exporter TauE/SafE family protein [Halieaceae bacterium]